MNEIRKENVVTHIDGDYLDPILFDLERIFQLKNQHLLSYSKLMANETDNASVDVAILNGLLKSLKPKVNNDMNNSQIMEELKYRAQLKLCLSLNRFDMAKQFINDETRDKVLFKVIVIIFKRGLGLQKMIKTQAWIF